MTKNKIVCILAALLMGISSALPQFADASTVSPRVLGATTGSLIAHYSFDGSATDSVGGNDGTLVGGPAFVAGKIGQAIQLDGVDDYVITDMIKSETALSNLNKITISYWIKPAVVSGYPIARWGAGRQFSQSLIANKMRLNWRVGGSNGSGTTIDQLGMANISTGGWYHIVAVYDGSSSKMYVNGNLDSVAQSGLGSGSSLNASVPDALAFGRMIAAANSYYNGLIDDVRIYNRALSQTDVSDMYSEAGGTIVPVEAVQIAPAGTAENDPGCVAANLFSTVTGRRCPALPKVPEASIAPTPVPTSPALAISAPSPAAPVIGVALKLGSSGPAVKALRTKLRSLGYFAPYGSSSEVPASAAVETSYFGATTEAAVKKYQCDAKIICSGLAATTGWGSVGPKTKANLGL